MINMTDSEYEKALEEARERGAAQERACLHAEPVDLAGIRGECWYCFKSGFVYRNSGGYNLSMCDACRDATRTPPTPEAQK